MNRVFPHKKLRVEYWFGLNFGIFVLIFITIVKALGTMSENLGLNLGNCAHGMQLKFMHHQRNDDSALS